jgi:hypothetical protein
MGEQVYQDRARAPLTTDDAPAPGIGVGTEVYVRSRYLGTWSGGFAVAEVRTDGYCIRRTSDGQVFPDVFAFDDVRIERRHNPMRGIEGSALDRRRFP